MKNLKTYNGWKNYETWNVMLWLNNTENLYFAMVDIVNECETKITYKEVIELLGLAEERTGDRVQFLDKDLDYKALNEAIREVA